MAPRKIDFITMCNEKQMRRARYLSSIYWQGQPPGPCSGVAPRYGKCWNICCLLIGSANVGTICGTNSYTLTYDRPGTHGWTDLPRTVSRPFRPTPWAVLAAPRVMPGPVMPGVQRTPGRLRGGDAPGGPDLPPCPGYRIPYIRPGVYTL